MEDREHLLRSTRRHFFGQCALGLGSVALAALLSDGETLAAEPRGLPNPLAPRKPHFPAKARSVIYLFMAGGPSQLELFDYKPQLQKYSGQPIPDSFIQGRRFAFMDIFTKEHNGPSVQVLRAPQRTQPQPAEIPANDALVWDQ